MSAGKGKPVGNRPLWFRENLTGLDSTLAFGYCSSWKSLLFSFQCVFLVLHYFGFLIGLLAGIPGFYDVPVRAERATRNAFHLRWSSDSNVGPCARESRLRHFTFSARRCLQFSNLTARGSTRRRGVLECRPENKPGY